MGYTVKLNEWYEYKGNKYKVRAQAQMKIGQLWIPSVVYGRDGDTYVRELNDFLEKFKPITENDYLKSNV